MRGYIGLFSWVCQFSFMVFLQNFSHWFVAKLILKVQLCLLLKKVNSNIIDLYCYLRHQRNLTLFLSFWVSACFVACIRRSLGCSTVWGATLNYFFKLINSHLWSFLQNFVIILLPNHIKVIVKFHYNFGL